MQLKVENREYRKQYQRLQAKVDASIMFLEDVDRISQDLLDKDFLVSLPGQILEIFKDKRTTFDKVVGSAENQKWTVESKVGKENAVKLNGLKEFLGG